MSSDLSLTSVPTAAMYCGFAYLGGIAPDRALSLKEITDDPRLENLKSLKLRFRFKAVSASNPDAAEATYGCRIEPLIENSYASRLGLGVVRARSQWQTFESMLDQGQNIESFLKSVATASPRAFKIIWSQNGSIANYRAGDTLLIDDIEITRIVP